MIDYFLVSCFLFSVKIRALTLFIEWQNKIIYFHKFYFCPPSLYAIVLLHTPHQNDVAIIALQLGPLHWKNLPKRVFFHSRKLQETFKMHLNQFLAFISDERLLKTTVKPKQKPSLLIRLTIWNRNNNFMMDSC